MYTPSLPGPAREISILYVGHSPVVEDATMRELQREKLINRVETVVDSRLAVERVRSAEQTIDLVLVEEEQAHADEWVLLKEVASLPPDRRPVVLVVAGMEESDFGPRARELGAAGRLVRPFRGDELARIIQTLPGLAISIVVQRREIPEPCTAPAFPS